MHCVQCGTANALFLEAPAEHGSPKMLEEYEASRAPAIESNQLLQSGIFPFKLLARPLSHSGNLVCTLQSNTQFLMVSRLTA